ncbi:MAG: DUF4214 domain-containing protein [Paracoccaceae bacterium]
MWENQIARVVRPDGHGTGFLVGPNDLITNVHVVTDENGDIVPLEIRFENGVETTAESVEIFPVSDFWDDPFQSFTNTRFDLALVTLEEPVGDSQGWFEIANGADLQVGSLETAGYPAVTFSGEEQRYDRADADYDLGRDVIVFESDEVEPGSSGSPVWAEVDGALTAVGVVAAKDAVANYAALFNDYSTEVMRNWAEDNDPRSPETVDAHNVALLYQGAFDRDGSFDWDGFNHYVGELADGRSLREISFEFLDSAEFERKSGEAIDPAAADYLSDADYIDHLYDAVLDRDADEDGFDFWTEVLEDGADRAQVMVDFALSDEARRINPHLHEIVEVEEGYWAYA